MWCVVAKRLGPKGLRPLFLKCFRTRLSAQAWLSEWATESDEAIKFIEAMPKAKARKAGRRK